MRKGLKPFLSGLLLALLVTLQIGYSPAQVPGGNTSQPIPVAPTQSMSAPTVATALTIPNGADYAVAYVEGASIRFTDDGVTAPTASVGALVAIGQSQPLTALKQVQIIQTAATATVTIRYYRYP